MILKDGIMKALILSLVLTLNMYTYQYKAKDFTYLVEKMPKLEKSLLEQHFKLYQGYVYQVNFLNSLIVDNRTNPFVFHSIKRQLGFEFDGMRLHELYFSNLGGCGCINQKSSLYNAIVLQFGSFEAWLDDFRRTCKTRGVGWAVLYLDEDTGYLYNAWIADHSRGAFVRGSPILVIDLWEHAYMTQFGLDKDLYIEIMLGYIDYIMLEKRFAAAAEK